MDGLPCRRLSADSASHSGSGSRGESVLAAFAIAERGYPVGGSDMSNDVPATGAVGGAEVMRTLAARSIEAGRPLGWYEELYAAADAGAIAVPWDHGVPTSLLAQWLQRRLARLAVGSRAVVIGCAYGDDAELVEAHGFETTAFDIAPSAIAAARRRHLGSTVHYAVADLLALPDRWHRHFDLVVECTTIQSMPPQLHVPAAAAVASLCADGALSSSSRACGPILRSQARRGCWPRTRSGSSLWTVSCSKPSRQFRRQAERGGEPSSVVPIRGSGKPTRASPKPYVYAGVGLVDRRGWLLMQALP